MFLFGVLLLKSPQSEQTLIVMYSRVILRTFQEIMKQRRMIVTFPKTETLAGFLPDSSHTFSFTTKLNHFVTA